MKHLRCSPVELCFYPKQNGIKLKFGQYVSKGVYNHQKKIPIDASWGNGFLAPPLKGGQPHREQN